MNPNVVKVESTQMSYRLKLDGKSRKAAKFISHLQKKIQSELVASGMTQQEVAEKLGVDRSVINRRLKGSANLTARSIAEFAEAFEKDLEVNFVTRAKGYGSNTTEVIHNNLTAANNVINLPTSKSQRAGVAKLESAAS